MSQASATVLIAHPTGLHARPAVKLTKLAKSFDAAIKLRAAGPGDLDRRQEHRQGHGR